MIGTSFFRNLLRPLNLLTFCMLLFTMYCHAEESMWNNFAQEQMQDPITMTLLPEEESIQPGRPFWVAIPIQIESGWHTYWKNPGATGMACRVDWQLPEGITVGSLLWPTPKRYFEETLYYFGYEGEVMLLAELIPSKELKTSSKLSIGATLNWVACNAETCLPGESKQTLELPVTSKVPLIADHYIPLFAEGRNLIPESNWKAVASPAGPGVIALTLAAPKGVKLGEEWVADFFPEREEGMSVTSWKQLEPLSSNQYRLLLAHTPDTVHKEKNPTSLQGVVVLAEGADASDYRAALSINVPVSQASSEMLESSTMAFFSYAFFFTLACAFLGGILLNCMPCVLPVISVKLMQLMKMAGGSRKVLMQHAMAYTVGILFSFWVLAGAIFLLRTYGQSVGWGFQLQEPIFVAFLALALFLFALNLFGLFEWGMLFASWAGSSSHQKTQSGLMGAFCSGVLATAMATPCTGPFLGSAVGLAVTLPASMGLLIFSAIGLGMSLPYTLLTISPRLMKYLPKPGAWMVRFKEGMGFLLLASVLWLVYVFASQTSLLATLILLTALFVASFAAWIYGNWSAPIYSTRVRWISSVLSFVLLGLSGYTIAMSSNSASKASSEVAVNTSDWVDFSPEAVEEAVRSGKPVLVDFTASWCLICQANHYVFETQRVRDQLAKHGVVKFKADWTLSNPVITEALRQHGRSGVPLYLLYPPYAETPIILPQLLTPESMLRFLQTMHQDQA